MDAVVPQLGRSCFDGAEEVVKKAFEGAGAVSVRLSWVAARRQLLLANEGVAMVVCPPMRGCSWRCEGVVRLFAAATALVTANASSRRCVTFPAIWNRREPLPVRDQCLLQPPRPSKAMHLPYSPEFTFLGLGLHLVVEPVSFPYFSPCYRSF